MTAPPRSKLKPHPAKPAHFRAATWPVFTPPLTIETVLADAAVRRNEMSLEGQAALLVKFDLERKIGARHLEIVEQRRVPDMRDHLSDIEA